MHPDLKLPKESIHDEQNFTILVHTILNKTKRQRWSLRKHQLYFSYSDKESQSFIRFNSHNYWKKLASNSNQWLPFGPNFKWQNPSHWPQKSKDQHLEARTTWRIQSSCGRKGKARKKLGLLLLLASLTLLSPHYFISILDSLALVGLRGPPLPDWSSKLTDGALVVATHNDPGVVLHLDLEPSGYRHPNRVGEPKVEDEILALKHGSVPDSHHLKPLLKPLGDAHNHVVSQGSASKRKMSSFVWGDINGRSCSAVCLSSFLSFASVMPITWFCLSLSNVFLHLILVTSNSGVKMWYYAEHRRNEDMRIWKIPMLNLHFIREKLLIIIC